MFILYTLVYLLFTYCMYVQANKSYNLSLCRGCAVDWDKHLWLFVIIFTMIGGFRWNVGADSYAYARGFKYPDLTMPLYWDNGEYLWYGLLWLHKTLGLHYVFGMCTAAFLQIFFITKAVKNNRYCLIFLPIVIFGSHYFQDMMNGVRQLIAASIFFYATTYITQRKLIKYCCLIIIASLFHRSALTLLPLYLLAYADHIYIRIFKRKWICIAVLLACCILGNAPKFQNNMQTFEYVANLLGYENMVENLYFHMDKGIEETRVNLFGLMQISYLLTAIFTIFYAPALYNKYKNNIQNLGLWLFLSYLYVCLVFLTQNLGISLMRPVMYLEYFHMIVIAILLYHFKSSAKYKKLNLFGILFIIIWTSNVWDIIKCAPFFPKETAIYKLFIFHNVHM